MEFHWVEVMDVEHLVFGLQTFFANCLSDQFTESYESLLDQLVSQLREEQNRSLQAVRGNLAVFCETLAVLLDHFPTNATLCDKLLKVVANAVVDNDGNRALVSDCSELFVAIERMLGTSDAAASSLNHTIIIFLKNLTLDNTPVSRKLNFLVNSVFAYLVSPQPARDDYMVVDVLIDLVDGNDSFKPKLAYIYKLIEVFSNVLNDGPELELEEIQEVLLNLSVLLEAVTISSALVFNVEDECVIQKKLISLFSKLEVLEISKLIIQRRLFASIGNISSNMTSINTELVPFAFDELKSSSNGYVISSCYLIISNSISSDIIKKRVIEDHPDLINCCFDKLSYLKDPVQYQSLLHLLKNLLNYSTVNNKLNDESKIRKIVEITELIKLNSSHYKNLNQLYLSFMNKLLTLSEDALFKKFVDFNLIHLVINLPIDINLNFVLLTIINKLLIFKIEFEFKDIKFSQLFGNLNSSPSLYIFQLIKTSGVVLRNKPELLINTPELLSLLNYIDAYSTREVPSGASGESGAILNNGKFIAGSVLQNRDSSGEFIDLAKKILNQC